MKIMDDDTITALAREYAEENAKSIRDTFGLPERAYYTHRDEDEKSFESVIRFLLHRYALVEKNRVEKEYKKACESVNKHSATTGCLFFVGQKQTIESLFPEIAKEVEE